MTARFDVVVVGAGPAGIAAATIAAESGRRVCLLDDNAASGGQIWRGFRTETARSYTHGRSFLDWTQRLQRTDCEVWNGWQAIDAPSPGLLRLERDGETKDIAFARLILATGARERFLPFHGWTLPGVMGAGGLQALVKSGLDPTEKRVVLAGSGPLLLAVAAGLTKSGARIAGIYEQAESGPLAWFGLSLLGQPAKLAEGARYRMQTVYAPYRTGSWVVRAEGRGRVEQVIVTDGRKQWTVACDWLGCGFHLVPNLELPRLLNCRIHGGYVAVDSLQQSSVPHLACVGELTGIGGVEKALVEGQIAGWAAAGRDAEAHALARRRKKFEGFAMRMERAFALRPELRGLADDPTLVCRCEDVTHAALTQCHSWREAKLHTRCGMGACQGRICGTAAEFLYGWELLGVRPPVLPAKVSTMAAEAERLDADP
jgi:NADPH-dependent 2,4-dienoyl-CoA reductase/sulfur reductase-like enzyme